MDLTFLEIQYLKLGDLFCDEVWCNEVAFFTDLFQCLNTLKTIQGYHENILMSTD